MGLKPARRLALLAVRFSAGVVLGLLLLEAVLRFFLFADLPRGTGISARLRKPGLYASQISGRDYWKLDALFSEPWVPRQQPWFDARTGWLGAEMDPATFAHADEGRLAGRTPVLLFGDSYAQCVQRAELCWQELLERSELADRYALLNYGVGGFGLDQAYLLLERVLERFRDRRPVVVMAILVDDDLDRSYLALRNYPKPCFTLDGQALVVHPVTEPDRLDFVRAHPVGIRSYLWRWLLFGSGLVAPTTAVDWTAEADHVAVKMDVNGRILAALQRRLEEEGLSYFFLLFHGLGAFDSSGPYRWQEPFLYRTFEDLHIPFVSSKRFLLAHMRRSGAQAQSFFYDRKPGLGHYTSEANAIVFEALRAGLEGRFEPYDYLAER